MSQSILQVNNLSKHFGGLAAVSNCSLKIKEGSITGIIGPNGSGKTTLFNLIAGNLKSSKGEVVFNDENITDLPSHELFAKGLLRTFQIAHEFSNLTVLENLMMVPANQSGENLINALLKPRLVKKEEEQVRSKAYDVVEFLNLKHLANERAGNLSGGQRQLLALGRALISKPDVILLDEPSAGLSPLAIEEVFEHIKNVNAAGVSILLVEQNAKRALKFCHRGYVLDQGRNAYTGLGKELLNDDKVVDLYLGKL